MSELSKEMRSVAEEQETIAYDKAAEAVNQLVEDLGPKVSMEEKKLVLVDQVDPTEAVQILSRLKAEITLGSIKLTQINLWIGDFANAFAEQMGIPMSKAANELADVFELKPKRVVRLMNTSKKSGPFIRESEVDYTLMQDLADIPDQDDEETQMSLMKAKEHIVDGVANHGKDRRWAKKHMNNVRHTLGIDKEKKTEGPSLLDLLAQYYNIKKLRDACSVGHCPKFGVDASEYDDQLRSLEASIENLMNARKFELWYEMDALPFAAQESTEDAEQLIEGLVE